MAERSEHIARCLEKVHQTQNEVNSKLKGEKIQATAEQKLTELATALQECPCKNDQQVQPALVSVLWEVNDNLGKISYYAENWRKLTWVTRKTTQATKIKDKLSNILQNITNFTKMIETLANMPTIHSVELQSNISMSSPQKGQLGNMEHPISMVAEGGGTIPVSNPSGPQESQHNLQKSNSIAQVEQKIMQDMKKLEDKMAEYQKFMQNKTNRVYDQQVDRLKQPITNQTDESPREITKNGKPVVEFNTEISGGEPTSLRQQPIMSVELPEISQGEKTTLDALCLLNGHGMEPNLEDALYFLNKAANSMGEARALQTLAEMAEEGRGSRVNKPKAAELYQKAANLNNPQACYKLALMLLTELDENKTLPQVNDIEVSQTLGATAGQTMGHAGQSLSGSVQQSESGRIALRLLKKAAVNGLSEAQATIGHIYEIGGYEDWKTGKFYPMVKKCQEKALSWYQKGAQQNNELALNFLGAYEYNTRFNLEEAVNLFRKACQSGKCVRALNNLALCLENGIGCQQDYQSAISYFKKASKASYAPASYNLAYLFFKLAKNADSEMDRSENLFECQHWLRIALDQNSQLKDAHFLLGYMYEKGLSVSLDLKTAFDHYNKAADQGHVKATTKIAHFYYSGIQENYQNLQFQSNQDQYFEENDMMSTAYSIDDFQDNEPVRYILEPNQELALKKYVRAGQKGDSEAYNCAALICEQQNNCIEAVEFYKRAIALDEKNSDAIFNMALLYYSKPEEKEWHMEAIELMKKSADLGNSKAQDYIRLRHLDAVNTNGGPIVAGGANLSGNTHPHSTYKNVQIDYYGGEPPVQEQDPHSNEDVLSNFLTMQTHQQTQLGLFRQSSKQSSNSGSQRPQSDNPYSNQFTQSNNNYNMSVGGASLDYTKTGVSELLRASIQGGKTLKAQQNNQTQNNQQSNTGNNANPYYHGGQNSQTQHSNNGHHKTLTKTQNTNSKGEIINEVIHESQDSDLESINDRIEMSVEYRN